MTSLIPESNVNVVAFNVAYHAVVDELIRPGAALVDLFSRMSQLAQELAGISHAAQSDWDGLSSNGPIDAEMVGTVERQSLSIEEAWAIQWALAHIAKHVHRELERVCLEHPAAQCIQSIEYDDQAHAVRWQRRTPS